MLFFIATLLRIRLAVTVERVETATFNPRVGNRSFNPLYRYGKSDFQRKRYETVHRATREKKNLFCECEV